MPISIFIPIICGILYRIGGTDQWEWCPINQKLWRWLGIGIFIGIIYAIKLHSWIPLLSIIAYAFAIQIGQYGKSSWLNFLGEWGKFSACGLALGLASIVILGPIVGLIQGIVGVVSFLIIKFLDDNDIIKNPWVELARGGFGCIMYIFA